MSKKLWILIIGIIIGIILTSIIYYQAKDRLQNHYEELNNYIIADHQDLVDFQEIRTSSEKRNLIWGNEINFSNMVYYEELELISFALLDELPSNYRIDVAFAGAEGIEHSITTGTHKYWGISYEQLFYQGINLDEGGLVILRIYDDALHQVSEYSFYFNT